MEEDWEVAGLVTDRMEAVEPMSVPLLSLRQVVAKKMVGIIVVGCISLVGVMFLLVEIKGVARIILIGQEGKQYRWI